MLLKFAAAMLAPALAFTASAQSNYPAKPVRLVTSAPGGGVDFTARLLGLGLSANLGQQFVIDNRGGTHVSSTTVANAAPDGYTVLVQNNTLWLAPLFVPAKTPAAIVARLNQASRNYLDLPETRERFAASGVEVISSTPQELDAEVKADVARIQKLIQAIGIRAD